MTEAGFPEITVRRRSEGPGDMREAFAIDVDRILHSQSYTAYIDKTQVFSLVGHQGISHRVIHVQLLSRIARTIGQRLGLNSDLVEAIAIGHDIGHPPFGHDGETYLDELCRESGIGRFRHNLQAMQMLEKIEKSGHGLNLTLPVLDGILCHNGEMSEQWIGPDNASGDFAGLDAKMRQVHEGGNPSPMTMEGCLVRVTDTVSYIGRDIEDSIALGIIRRDELPAEAVQILGDTNGKIVYSLVEDITNNSGHGRIAYSPEVYGALQTLKQFNYERIYLNQRVKAESRRIRTLYRLLFELLVDDLKAANRQSPIFRLFLDRLDDGYAADLQPAEIVRDFLASLTDSNFLRLFENIFLPRVPEQV